ncbi:MAG TPA: YhjD/YihY/BrkB family envelope integrity protein [Geobacteraceae bacterium]|nr:YhjD/YihY/BrkB family envelope integrity protein [Geobacteraceae bacterium]
MGKMPIKSRFTDFFSTTIWHLEPESYKGIKRQALKYLQVLALVCRDFHDDHCMLRASALSFSTILSLVPFFALTFAVLKGFGVHNKLEPFILGELTASSQETVDRIVTYINNTNMTSLGTIGLAALILTVVTLLGNIEEAFNVIWGVRETRSFYRKFSDYMSVVVTGPILLLAAISITTSLQSQALVKWLVEYSYLGDFLLFIFRLAPYFIIWLALVFLYIFIPNTRVRFGSALFGGILAGTVWQLAQWGYIHFQVGVAKYNAIYGTLALLPIFMVWIYTSWLIVLFGVEVVYAHQNIRTFRRELRNSSFSHGQKEFLCLAILQDIAAAFHHERELWTPEQLSEDLDIPLRVVREMLMFLVETGFITATAGESPHYIPARELERIAVADVLNALKNHGDICMITRMTDEEKRIRDILARLENCSVAALEGMTLKDMVSGRPHR